MPNPHHGKHTGKFGLWLTKYIQSLNPPREYTVVYDHGDAEKYPNVAVIKGFYGGQVANKNRLADIDVMVANSDGEVLLLIEIEESKMPPKTLLGDVFSILFSNNVAVKMGDEQKYFSISPETRLIVAGVVRSKGDGQEKIKDVIMPRLREFNVPGDAIQVENVDFVFGDDVEEVMGKLRREVETLLSLRGKI